MSENFPWFLDKLKFKLRDNKKNSNQINIQQMIFSPKV